MGAWFVTEEFESCDNGDIVVLHRSTGKLYPEGEYHVPVWGPWFSDAPMWTRYCIWGYAHGNGANQGCDLQDHTFTNPMEQT